MARIPESAAGTRSRLPFNTAAARGVALGGCMGSVVTERSSTETSDSERSAVFSARIICPAEVVCSSASLHAATQVRRASEEIPRATWRAARMNSRKLIPQLHLCPGEQGAAPRREVFYFFVCLVEQVLHPEPRGEPRGGAARVHDRDTQRSVPAP